MAFSIDDTKILPSPILPVLADSSIHSTATGKGRFFSQEDHDRKLNAIDSYVFCDLRDRFQTAPKFYEIPVTKVLELQECGIIKEGKVTRNQFFKLFPYEEYALRN